MFLRNLEIVQPKLRTNRKWKVRLAVNAATKSLKLRKIVGCTQTKRQRLDSKYGRKWHRRKGSQRALVIQDVSGDRQGCQENPESDLAEAKL